MPRYAGFSSRSVAKATPYRSRPWSNPRAGRATTGRSPGWAGLLELKGRLLPLADGAALLGETGAGSGLGRGLVIRGRLPLGFTVGSVVGLTAGASRPLTTQLGFSDLVSAALPVGDATYLVLDAEGALATAPFGATTDAGRRRLRPLPLGGRSVAAATPTPRAAPPAPPAPPLVVAGAGHSGSLGVAQTVSEAFSARLSQLVAAPFTPPQTQVAATQPPTIHQSTAAAAPPTQTLSPDDSTDFPGGTVLIFHAGLEADLAVPLDQVLEIGPAQEPAPVHGGSDQIVGVLNFHGRLVPLVDLPARLGYTSTGPARRSIFA